MPLPLLPTTAAALGAYLGYDFGKPAPEDEKPCFWCIGVVVGILALGAFYTYSRWYRRRRG